MLDFNPIVFGDHYRYVAISKDSFWFVFDAEVYDYRRDNKASCIAYGSLSSVGSLAALVGSFVSNLNYSFIPAPYNLWSMELSTEELISLYEEYDRKRDNLDVIIRLYRNCTINLLYNINDSKRAERAVYDYLVITPTGVSFKGSYFCPAPSSLKSSDLICDDLLFWIVLKPGDTDQDHFKDYTEEQLEWSISIQCQELELDLMEEEERRAANRL